MYICIHIYVHTYMYIYLYIVYRGQEHTCTSRVAAHSSHSLQVHTRLPRVAALQHVRATYSEHVLQRTAYKCTPAFRILIVPPSCSSSRASMSEDRGRAGSARALSQPAEGLSSANLTWLAAACDSWRAICIFECGVCVCVCVCV